MEYMTEHLPNQLGDGLNEYLKLKREGGWYKVVWDDHSVMYIVRDNKFYGGYSYHRPDGPCIITGKVVMFFVEDLQYEYTKLYCEAAGMSDEETFMWVLRFGERLPRTFIEYYGDELESIPVDQL